MILAAVILILGLLSVPSDEDVRRAGWTKSLRKRT